MESEESFNGLGLSTREEEFYPVSKKLYTYPKAEGVVGGMIITTSEEATQHNRAIYNTLDFLGDVGGLLDMLRLFAEVFLELIAFLFGSGLD